MSYEAFEELNRRQAEAGQRLFTNPRNAAAGSVRMKDASITASRQLGIWIYQAGIIEGGPSLATHQTMAYLLASGSRQQVGRVDDLAGGRLTKDAEERRPRVPNGVVKSRSTRSPSKTPSASRRGRVGRSPASSPEGGPQAPRHPDQRRALGGVHTPSSSWCSSAGRTSPGPPQPGPDRFEGHPSATGWWSAPGRDPRGGGAGGGGADRRGEVWQMPASCPFCGHPIVRPEGGAVALQEGMPLPPPGWLFHFAGRGGMDIGTSAIGPSGCCRSLIRSPAGLFRSHPGAPRERLGENGGQPREGDGTAATGPGACWPLSASAVGSTMAQRLIRRFRSIPPVGPRSRRSPPSRGGRMIAAR